ncbi:hypothetical protein RF11_06804 [Thelohanellus kitauei]|uniref:Uncharacterized protein n=1 Tax=Thelohanellus kitauei TaxID=669202 RepID=A0A0C2ISD7_THEKT|nr:hypothetical protein RF11_06804 [Thelohanellus kitauei]
MSLLSDVDIQSNILISKSYNDFYYFLNVICLSITCILCVLVQMGICTNMMSRPRISSFDYCFIFVGFVHIYTILFSGPALIVSSLLGEWVIGEKMCIKIAISVFDTFILSGSIETVFLIIDVIQLLKSNFGLYGVYSINKNLCHVLCHPDSYTLRNLFFAYLMKYDFTFYLYFIKSKR